MPSLNIAEHLVRMAATEMWTPALKVPQGRKEGGRIDYLSLTFLELDAEVNAWCAHLGTFREWQGVRTLVMVPQGLPLIAAVFALFKLGAVPIVIDPGMGLKNFLRCVARSRPKALVGTSLAQILSRLFFRKFRSLQWRIKASSSPTNRLHPVAVFMGLRGPNGERVTMPSTLKAYPKVIPSIVKFDALAAILFTSGSTGAPKGVCYTHGMFEAQLGLIRAHYGIVPGETDLPLLPVFALFNPALGMTTVVPEMDPRRPAQVDPAKIVQAIVQEGVTNSFGSPTLWLKIKRHCVAHGVVLPSLRRILCAGAPVPAELWEDTATWLPNGQIHSPYGATEALPLCSVSSDEMAVLRRSGNDASPNKPVCDRLGACVGRPLPGITIKIIEIVDRPIRRLGDVRELPRGEIGEIVVGGPNVTQHYDALPEATARAKVGIEADETEGRSGNDAAPNKNSLQLHRMGDAGYLDDAGRLWFCGRVVERVRLASGRTLYTEPCEQVFRAHDQVERCALIGLGTEAGAQVPALVVQPRSPKTERAALACELRTLALAHPHTREIERIYFHPDFPVDVRHNAKIHRHTLAHWAAHAPTFYG